MSVENTIDWMRYVEAMAAAIEAESEKMDSAFKAGTFEYPDCVADFMSAIEEARANLSVGIDQYIEEKQPDGNEFHYMNQFESIR